MKGKIMLALGLLLLLAVAFLPGEQMSLKATIEFPFMVEGKTLPPGQYEFRQVEEGMAFRVQGDDKKGATALIITRLDGTMRASDKSSYVVFDAVGDTNTLSEIWLPGEDGYLLAATKGRHTHKIAAMK